MDVGKKNAPVKIKNGRWMLFYMDTAHDDWMFLHNSQYTKNHEQNN